MAKARKARLGILIPVVEEVPRISDAERKALRASLEKARGDIAAGNYDVLTPAALREEFESTFGRRKTADKADAAPLQRPVSRRTRR